jgi:hypothetical protein
MEVAASELPTDPEGQPHGLSRGQERRIGATGPSGRPLRGFAPCDHVAMGLVAPSPNRQDQHEDAPGGGPAARPGADAMWERPVIAAGTGRPRSSRTVGATSVSSPPGLSVVPASGEARMKGTGLSGGPCRCSRRGRAIFHNSPWSRVHDGGEAGPAWLFDDPAASRRRIHGPDDGRLVIDVADHVTLGRLTKMKRQPGSRIFRWPL